MQEACCRGAKGGAGFGQATSKSTSRSTNVGSSSRGQRHAPSWMRNAPPRQSLSKKRRIVSNVVRSSKHSSPIPMRTQPRFQRHLQKCRGGRCPHVVSRIVGVESVADVTQIAASQFRFETVLSTHAASLKQGESLQLRLCRECVGCLGGRSGGPACGSRGRGQSDRFCGASAEQVCHSGSH